MKILHITFSLNNGGKENMLVDIANEQASDGNDLAIVVINDQLNQDLLNRICKSITLYRINRKHSSKNILHIFKLILILNFRCKPNIIHSHDPQLGLLLKLTSFIPTVLTIHGPAFNTSKMKWYDKLIAVSKSVKADVESRSKNVCEIIYNGVKITSIYQKEPVIKPDNFRIISVGRLDHLVKGQDLLIEAANYLVNIKGLNSLKFFFVGEGKSRKYIEDLILNFNLNENVFLLGNKNRDWIFKNLHSYDLFIQPSRLEGFGLTVAESMAAKVPVIASDIEGPAEILENGKYGIMFRNNNAEDLAGRIEYAIGLYESGKIIGMIETAHNHCINNFSITRTARQYCQSYL